MRVVVFLPEHEPIVLLDGEQDIAVVKGMMGRALALVASGEPSWWRVRVDRDGERSRAK